jgi:teichuronic acid biosynthesis glycosyltransferase TuaC
MPQNLPGTPALHVLTITPFFPSDQNEVNGCFVAEPIEQLRQFGVDCSVLAVSPLHHPQKRPTTGAQAAWVRYPQIPGILGLSSAGKFLYGRLMTRVENLHRVKPIAVIHAHSALPCGQAAARLSSKLNIPFVVTVHGLDVFNTLYRGGISATWRRKASVDVYRAARMVLCISGKVQEILNTESPAQINSTVVYNGVNPDLFSPGSVGLELSDPEILIVGNLQRSKGHELVLRAIEKLQPSFPQLRCRIIGEGPDRPRFEALACELGIDSRVQSVGRQSRQQVAEAMRRCSVFVLPSSNEGLGCVYLEAMACAKPVIACRGQGIEEVIEHEKNGWLIPVDGIEELVQALSTLLASPGFCSTIGNSARRTILEKLTLAHQAQNLASIYREVISQNI